MSDSTSNFPIMGGIIAAIGTGLCCAGPFVLAKQQTLTLNLPTMNWRPDHTQ